MIVLLLVAFLLELVAFFSIGALALLVETHTGVQIALFFVLFSMVIIFWGLFMSPKAPKKLAGKKYYLAKGVIYLIAAIALTLRYNLLIGLVFIVIWGIDELLLYIKEKPRTSRSLS